jgi:hypothetical protein
MKNIHVLATPNPSRLIYNDANQLCYQSNKSFKNDRKNRKKFNIYITSDEEIKEGDWIILDNSIKELPEYQGLHVIQIVDNTSLKSAIALNCKKIILTTDVDLIKDGVQAIDEEFLEWFVKNPSCESIVVESYYRVKSGTIQEHKDGIAGYEYYEYKIIIPKEEPKQEIVGYRLNSNISRLMVDRVLQYSMPKWNDEDKSVYFIRGHVGGSLVAKMKELQVLDLWFIPIYEDEEIKSDWVKENHLEYYYKEGIMKEEPKQETLEEVAETELYITINKIIDGGKNLIKGTNVSRGQAVDYAFDIALKIAKWQAKRMYSEEEVRHLLIECCGEVSCEDGTLLGKTPDDLANWIDIKLKKK